MRTLANEHVKKTLLNRRHHAYISNLILPYDQFRPDNGINCLHLHFVLHVCLRLFLRQRGRPKEEYPKSVSMRIWANAALYTRVWALLSLPTAWFTANRAVPLALALARQDTPLCAPAVRQTPNHREA